MAEKDRANEQLEELQKRTLEAMRQQQEAFLEGVKAWREMLTKGTVQPPPSPDIKPPDLSPQPAEVFEASYAFASKLLAEQSQFLAELSKAMATPPKKN
jgi:hypothetical protein